MFKKFEQSDSKKKYLLVFLRRRGILNLFSGIILVMMLLILGIYSLFNSPKELDIAALNQPPAFPVGNLFDQSICTINNGMDGQVRNGKSVGALQKFKFDPFEAMTRTSPLSPNTQDTKIVFSSKPVRNARIGHLYKYQIQVSTEDTVSVSYQLQGQQLDMRLDPQTGSLTWTPRQAGSYPVEIRVISSGRIIGSQKYDLIVSKEYHFLGTTSQGLDVADGLIAGTKSALFPSSIAVITMLILGIFSGAISGYYSGISERFVSLFTRIINSFPRLVLIFLIASIFKLNIYLTMFFLGWIYFPQIAADIRTRIESLKKQQFIEASKEMGIPDHIIIFKHILWYNCRPVILSQISYGFAIGILMEVTLSYLGFGVQQPNGSWGKMLYSGSNMMMNGFYWQIAFPSFMVIIAILGFFLLRDGLNRYFAVKSDEQ